MERGGSDAGQGLQKELGNPTQPGLAVKLGELGKPRALEDNYGGGSDDIGDVSWNMPTVTLSYPANIPGLPGHNWSTRSPARRRSRTRAWSRARRCRR